MTHDPDGVLTPHTSPSDTHSALNHSNQGGEGKGARDRLGTLLRFLELVDRDGLGSAGRHAARQRPTSDSYAADLKALLSASPSPAGALTNADAELQKLIHYFCGEGQEFGNEGDGNLWTTAETAIEVMRRWQRRTSPPGAVDKELRESGLTSEQDADLGWRMYEKEIEAGNVQRDQARVFWEALTKIAGSSYVNRQATILIDIARAALLTTPEK